MKDSKTALVKKRKTTYGSQVDKVVKREISVALRREHIRQALLEWIALENAKEEKKRTKQCELIPKRIRVCDEI